MAHSPALGTPAAALTDAARVESVAHDIALLSSGALSEISALCSLSLAALESPGTFHLEHLALCIQVIRAKADDIANCIDYEAEQINIIAECPRVIARRAARQATGA